MSETIARYNVIFELLTKQTGDIEKIRKESTGLQGTFSRAKAAYAGIIAANVTQAAISNIQGVINKGIGLAAQFETTSQSFKVLIGDFETAKTLIQDLNKFSIETPFEPAEIQASAKTLLGFGRTAKDVQDDIRIIGNASAATSADLQGLAVVFGQVAGLGKLQGQDALQFINQGIPVYQILSEYLGKSVSEVKKLQEQGKITFDDLRASFVKASEEGGKFYGALEQQSKTFSGLMSTLRGNVDEAFKGIGEALLPILKPLVAEAGKFFEDLLKTIQEKGPEIRQFFTDLFSVAVPVMKAIGSLFFTAGKIIVGFLAVLVGLPRFFKENATVLKAFVVALVALNGHLVITKGLLLANNLVLIAKYGTMARAAKGVTLLRTAQLALNAAFRANPIGVVVTAIALLVAGFDLLYKKSENVRAGIAGIANVFKNLGNLLDGGIGNFFTNIKREFNKGFDDSIKEAAGKGTNRGSLAGFQENLKKIAFERKQKEAEEKKRLEEERKAREEAAKEALQRLKEREEQLLKTRVTAVERNYAIEEQKARDTIKNEEDLSIRLKQIELERQIAVATIKQQYSQQQNGKFLSKEDELNFIKFGNEIKELEAQYDALFKREKINPLELLSPSDMQKVTTGVKLLEKELIKLSIQFNKVSDPEIKRKLGEQIIDLQKSITDFQIPEFKTAVFLTGGFDAIDVTQLDPKDQVSALKTRFELLGDAMSGIKDKIKEGTANVTDLVNFDALADEYQKILEILERIGQKKISVLGLSEEELGLVKQGIDQVLEAFSLVTEFQIAEFEKQIEAQQARVSKASEIAEKGNVEQLKLEEERLREIEEKRKTAADRQLVLEKVAAQAQIVVNTALTTSNIITTLTKEGASKGIIGAAVSLSILGGLIASAANIFKAPTFWHGTEEVGSDPRYGNSKVSSGRDGYWARFDGTERIVDGPTNKALKGIPNHMLPKAVEALETIHYPKLNFDIPGPSNNKKEFNELRDELREMRKSFESLKITTKLDVNGFMQNIEQRVDKVTRRKRIRG